MFCNIFRLTAGFVMPQRERVNHAINFTVCDAVLRIAPKTRSRLRVSDHRENMQKFIYTHTADRMMRD